MKERRRLTAIEIEARLEKLKQAHGTADKEEEEVDMTKKSDWPILRQSKLV